MNATLLGQLVALGGLVGAVGAYAGILRRRRESRDARTIVEASNSAAVQRVERMRALDRVSD